LSLLEKERIDVVVLDVKMPGMDGITALKEIKRRFPSIEVIMLTGHATIESATEGIQSGAYDYLIKPVAPRDLIKKAQSAYEKRAVKKPIPVSL
jgi:DNA-binding NtrC family response regulator